MMKAAVLVGPGKIEVQDKPIPQPTSDSAVVKITQSALCGSDLHYYRYVPFRFFLHPKRVSTVL